MGASLAALMLAMAGCAAGPEAPAAGNACTQAVELAATCHGETAGEAIPDADCTEDARAVAEEIVAGGCEGLPPPEAKADSFACTGWRGRLLRRANQCDLEPLFPDPDVRRGDVWNALGRNTTRYPIVLVHGFNTGPGNSWGFPGIPEALGGPNLDESCGPEGLAARCYSGGGDWQPTYFALLPPFEGVGRRAEQLAQHIDRALAIWGTPKVHLIAHSMGGLDSRDVIDRLGYGDRVASLTTVATTHHGTGVAEVALGFTGAFDGTNAEQAMNMVAAAFGTTFNEASTSADLFEALRNLSLTGAAEFNATHPNDPRVQYYTWAAVSSVPGIPFDEGAAVAACGGPGFVRWHGGTWDETTWALRPSHLVIGGWSRLPNDGLAPVQSSISFPAPELGNAPANLEYRGCIPADHMDQVNSARPNRETGFDHVRFWRNLALDLVELEAYRLGL